MTDLAVTPILVNSIKACNAKNQRLNKIEDLEFIVIHRISLSVYDKTWNPAPIADHNLDAIALSFRFGWHNSPTGGLLPYHFLLRKDGVCEQMLPIQTRGAHTIGVNWKSIGLAVAMLEGDELTDAQKASLPLTIAALVPLGSGLKCIGHTDIPGASFDKNKICPGFLWHPYEHAALSMMPEDWRSWDVEKRDTWSISKGVAINKPISPLVA